MSGATDFSGYETSVSPEVIGHWDAATRAFIAHSAATPTHLEATLKAAPNFAQAHAAKGLFCLLLGRSELVDTARDCATTARRAAKKQEPTQREEFYLLALEAWLAGKPSTAAAIFEQVLVSYPRDALAMKMVQAIQFMLGKPKLMRQSIERILPLWDDHPARGYLKGCYAFTLEETGEYENAERAGREGLLLAPDDAWGLHAVAHVYDMTGRAEDGLFWLSGQTAAWEHCNNFRYHVWWHIALMHLDLGQIDEVFHLYDTEIRKDHTDDYRDISNGASLLSRLEIEGIDVGDRWEELAEISARRANDGTVVFADLHYLLSLMGGNRSDATRTLMTRMAHDAARCETEMDKLMKAPGFSAANGLEAYGEGRYAEAYANLATVRPDMQKIGGSHAQRDVFERLTIEAALRGGLLDSAQRLLTERTENRGGAVDHYTERRLAVIEDARQQALVTSGGGSLIA